MSIKARVDKARAERDAAADAVFAFAEHANMRFSDCFARADAETRAKYEASLSAVSAAEDAAIDKGRAYRGSFGMLVWRA